MATNRNLEYLGVGVAWPYRVDQFGKLALVDGLDNLEQAIVHRLATPQGSVLMNRVYGSKLHLLQFEPNLDVLEDLARITVQQCLANEGRVKFRDMASRRDLKLQKLDFVISYLVLASNQVKSLIYPFYLANQRNGTN